MTQDNKLSLAEKYWDYFKIGAAVNVNDFSGIQGELLKTHFNSITAENAMKFGEIHPEEDRYDFEKADAMKTFAKSNNILMRGHTFVWHNQTSNWVFTDKNGREASRELVLERLTQHVKIICDRYKDIVYAWDVVNEAIEDKSGQQYRETAWRRILGADYIQTVFEIVKAQDRKAALVYNDYNNEHPEKLEKTCHMLEILLKNGTPVDSVGIQAHWNIRDISLIDNLKRAIERYAALGLKIQVTEMDVSMFDFNDRRNDLKLPTDEMLELQAQVYDDIFSVFRQYKEHVTSVTFWGISDAYTWKDNFPVFGRKDWPLLFNVSGAKKAAFDRVVDFYE
jgi:endo-1,4-beta-xylanase